MFKTKHAAQMLLSSTTATRLTLAIHEDKPNWIRRMMSFSLPRSWTTVIALVDWESPIITKLIVILQWLV